MEMKTHHSHCKAVLSMRPSFKAVFTQVVITAHSAPTP